MTSGINKEQELLVQIEDLKKQIADLKMTSSENEDSFRKLSDYAAVGVFLNDAQGKVIYINKKCAELVGVPPDKALHFDWIPYLHPDDRERMVSEWEKAFKNSTEFRSEYRWVHRDGKIVWTLGQVVPILGEDGQAKMFIGTLSDISEHKVSEQKLAESQRLLGETGKIGKVGGWEVNIDTWQQQWTEEVYHIHEVDLDFNPNVEKGINFYDEESRPIISEAFQRAVEYGESYDVQLDIITAKGNRRHVHAIGIPDLENRRVYGFFQDITAQAQADMERRRLALVVDSSSEFIGMCNLDMEPHYVNPAGLRMVGLPDLKAACQVKVQDYFFPEDQKFIAEEFFPRVLREGQGEVEIRLRHFQTGEPIWVHYVLFSVSEPNGKIIGWATVSNDISERKRVEKKLRESEERFANAFQVSPAAITITRVADGTFIDVNQAFLNLFEFSRDEVIGHTSTELNMISVEEREQLIRKQLETGGLREAEFLARSKSGKPVHLLFSSAPMELANELHHVTTMIDLSGRKQVEKEREALIAELQQKAAEQERFIYTFSHDMKTPLVTISGFCGLAKADFSSGNQEQGNKNLDVVSNAAIRMRQLLDELLHLSRVGFHVNPNENINLKTLIEEAIENIAGVVTENKTTIEVESVLPDVFVDRQYILQVFENLITNASRYSRSATSGSHVKVGVTHNAQELICYVEDNGIGIESRYLEKVFGLFEKLDTETYGTGVGLAIAKRIIENHGGRIWAESEGLGKGTTFFFTLPEAKQQ